MDVHVRFLPLNPPPEGDSTAFGVSAGACALEYCSALTLGDSAAFGISAGACALEHCFALTLGVALPVALVPWYGFAALRGAHFWVARCPQLLGYWLAVFRALPAASSS